MFCVVLWVKDAYVLCRVFHKNNIGPPNSHRYAPFIEEEWDDAIPAFLPGEEVRIQVVADLDSHAKEASHDARVKEAGIGAFVEGNDHSAYVENYGECVENRQDSFVEGNNFGQVCAFLSFIFLLNLANILLRCCTIDPELCHVMVAKT